MKNYFTIFLLCWVCTQLPGQPKLSFFLAPNIAAGLGTQPSEIYPVRLLGSPTGIGYHLESTDTSSSTPYQYRLGLDFGMSWRDQLFVFTGIGYMARHDRGVPVCDVCSFAYHGGPIQLQHYFWEIPIGMNFLFTAQKRVTPFVGISTIFSKSAKSDNFRSQFLQWRLGTSFRMSNKTSFQLAFYAQNNRRTRIKSYYTFRELGLQLSFVKLFRKSE